MVIRFVTMNTTDYNTAISSRNFSITYGFHPTPFGECLIGITNHGNAICHLWFFDGLPDDCLAIMATEWPKVQLIEGTHVTNKIIEIIFHNNMNHNDLYVLLKGTDFQIHVWKTIINISEGDTVTYSDIAKSIGNPKAVRAVATAIARNRIGYLVPCHRVLPKNSSNSKFRWGNERRFAILNHEKENAVN